MVRCDAHALERARSVCRFHREIDGMGVVLLEGCGEWDVSIFEVCFDLVGGLGRGRGEGVWDESIKFLFENLHLPHSQYSTKYYRRSSRRLDKTRLQGHLN